MSGVELMISAAKGETSKIEEYWAELKADEELQEIVGDLLDWMED